VRENRSKSSMTNTSSRPRSSTSPELGSLTQSARPGAPVTESDSDGDSDDTGAAPRDSIMSSASGRYLAEVAPFLCGTSSQSGVDAESHAEQLASFFAAASPPPPSVASIDRRTADAKDLTIIKLRHQVADLEMCAALCAALAQLANAQRIHPSE
jgi:hypothetical protein